MTESTATYRIWRANHTDLPALLGLRRHAEQWLAGAGVEQWTSSATGDRVITAWVDAGYMYVVADQADEIVGCLALAGGDPDFWTPEELEQPALYLYKFILRSDHRGTGLGDVLLDWACLQAEILHYLWLRLDCRIDNTKLHRYYLDRGFQHIGNRPAEGRQSGALFERIAELHTADDSPVRLIDETDAIHPPKRSQEKTIVQPERNRYDPTGEAAIWAEAAAMVSEMKLPDGMPDDVHGYWNAALTQAARALEKRGGEVRQAGGMYYRVLDGSTMPD
ncbi:GNAT family N-acetyltransferase [Kribbella sp. NPDC020789]